MVDPLRDLYKVSYADFLSLVPRPLLESFATQTAQDGTADKIAQVYDQYLNLLVSEPDLLMFSLHIKGTYYALNSARLPTVSLRAQSTVSSAACSPWP